MFHGPFSRRASAIVVFGSAIVGFGAIFGSAYYAQRLKGLW
jgi:archaellum component FlaF (FlaF/FlaG flagellin family)